ncbi:uncharacterized protein LOC131669872 [Phymastichus coffea]|uniref:uncharacterized protein LOC131669872 n=1 Tax=Phymastichus coffea TaxID=108790 RepID=UPI00273A7CEE|nr:uncharacterized protein LOC131669872 [Phymastichus coffea]
MPSGVERRRNPRDVSFQLKMLRKSTIIAFLVALCVTRLHLTDAAIRTIQNPQNFPNQQVMFDRYSFKEGHLIIAVCNKEPTPKERNCTVIQEKYPSENFTRTCNISLKAEQENGKLSEQIGVATFGADRAILFWQEQGTESNFKLSTVQLATCKFAETKLLDSPTPILTQVLSHRKILTYDNSYDIFFEDEKRCNDKECKMTVDGEGKVVVGPTAHMKKGDYKIGFTSPIATHSPSKGYTYSKSKENEYAFWIVKPDASEKQILSAKKRNAENFMSAIYDTIGYCARTEFENKYITCTQYNANGDVKFTMNVTDVNDKTRMLTMHNSPHGGFLLMLVEYDKCEKANCVDAINHQVIKVNGEGKKVGSLKLQPFKIVASEKKLAQIYENGDEECCAAFLSHLQIEPNNFNVTVECFADADFMTYFTNQQSSFQTLLSVQVTYPHERHIRKFTYLVWQLSIKRDWAKDPNVSFNVRGVTEISPKNQTMLKLPNVLGVIAIVAIAQCDDVVVAMKVMQKLREYPSQELVFSRHSFVDERLVYAICNRTTESSDDSSSKGERNCTVIREKSSFSNDTHRCDVNVKAKDDNGTIYQQFQVVPFGRDKAIFVSEEIVGDGAFIELRTIQLAECKVNENRFAVNILYAHEMHPAVATILVAYEHSFDVFFENTKQCRGKFCRATINSEGKILSGPAESIETSVFPFYHPTILPLKNRSPDKGLFYLDSRNSTPLANGMNGTVYTILQLDGSRLTLGSSDEIKPGDAAISTSHNLITVCHLSENINIKCLQYDVEHKLKLNATLHGHNEKTEFASMYNLPDGSFYLLLGEHETANVRLSVTKINSTGKKIGNLVIIVPNCDLKTNYQISRMYENEAKEYCVSVACYNNFDSERTLSFLSVSANCFTDLEFSENIKKTPKL